MRAEEKARPNARKGGITAKRRNTKGSTVLKNTDFASNGEKTAVICVNDTIALEAAEISPDNCLLFSIDGTPEALGKGVISCLQPMEKMAEKCLLLLKKQQDLGSQWVASEYRIKGEILRKC